MFKRILSLCEMNVGLCECQCREVVGGIFVKCFILNVYISMGLLFQVFLRVLKYFRKKRMNIT